MPTLEAIKKSCPAIISKVVESDQGVKLTQDEWEELSGEGRVKCMVTEEQQTRAGISWGCRYVVAIEPSGCPLRNGDWVKVRVR